jgi:DNA-binding MarR family transcriptional regulator
VGRQLDDFKLSMMEWLLLASVCNGPTSGMSMSEVAAVLDVTLPQVTALMNDLVAMKLVKQKVDAADRRSRKLMCTLQGKRLLGKVEHAINKAMRQWLQDVTHEEFQAYMNTVRLLATQQI